jgi:uncharacterized protein (TIGR00251 family)
MKITVHVKPNSKTQSVLKINEAEYKIQLKSLPVDGKANEELISVLAKEFSVRKRDVTILHGGSSKKKLVEIDLG